MDEAGWLASPVAERLLNYLKGRTGERTLRLSGVACCRLQREKVTLRQDTRFRWELP
jgi:hypothetical protein